MFQRDHIYRLTKAGVLAALAAVPISVGLAAGALLVQVLCFAVGVLLWLWALALLLPRE
jgi:hypothetical protein